MRDEPEVVGELLGNVLDVPLPAFVHATVESGDLSELEPTELRADAVVTLADARGDPVAAVVVEMQRTKDSGKRFAWPAYLATLLC